MNKVAITTICILFGSCIFASSEFDFRAHDDECLRHHPCKPIPQIDLPAWRDNSGDLEPFMGIGAPHKTDVNQPIRHTFNHIVDLVLKNEWFVVPHVFYTVKQLVSEARDIPLNDDGTAKEMAGKLWNKRLMDNISMQLHEIEVHHV